MGKMDSAGHLFVGVIAILIGAFFLADNFGWIPRGMHLSRFWPVLLILFGIWIIFGDRIRR